MTEPLRRECVLTAFSLDPTHAMYEKVKECAKDLMPDEDEKKKEEGAAETSINTDFRQGDVKDDDAFEKMCDVFCSDLATEKAAKASRAAKKAYFPGSLISVHGSVVTSRPDYDPLAPPLDVFRCDDVVPLDQLTDLLVQLSAARWALLSWALDWPELEDNCKKLLASPQSRYAREDLKYLVIDYTQFDEWSSDEEIDESTGIERGYENNVEFDSSEDEDEDEGEEAKKKAAVSRKNSSDEEKSAKNPQEQEGSKSTNNKTANAENVQRESQESKEGGESENAVAVGSDSTDSKKTLDNAKDEPMEIGGQE